MVVGTRKDDAGLVIVHLHTLDDSLDRIALAIEVVGDLLRLGQREIVVVIVADQHLALPHLIDLAGDDLAHLLRILLEECGLFQIEDARCQILTQRQHGATAELGHVDLVGILVAHLVGGVDRLDLRHRNLGVGVLDRPVLDDGTVAPDLQIALLGVDDDVEILVALELLLQSVTEDILQNTDQRSIVDALQLLELSEIADKIHIIHRCFSFYIFY